MPVGRAWLSRNVVLLGTVSLLTDTASEMIVPLLPIFLSTSLGAGATALGLIEGAADATASLLKLLSGRWADRLRRYRPLLLLGYGLSSASRPLVALAGAPWHVLAVRLSDRVGKGLRTSPRDALLASSVPPEHHGAAFGFHRGMDHAGAALGPLLASGLLALGFELRWIFAAAAVPSLLTMLVAFMVREPPGGTLPAPDLPQAAPPASRGLGRLLIPFTLFGIANASDTFLLLRASTVGLPVAAMPLLWMALHLVKAATSMAGGRLSDRVGRRFTVGAGWSVHTVIFAALALATDPTVVAALIVAYGLSHGLFEAPERALVAELAPPSGRGGAFGWFHLVLGVAALASSVLFGSVWERFGAHAAFAASAGVALAAVLVLVALAPGRVR